MVKRRRGFPTSLWTPAAEPPSPTEASVPFSQGMPTGAVQAPIPERIHPMLCVSGAAFSHPDWLFELKWDGWRAIAYGEKAGLRVQSRKDVSLLGQFAELRDLHTRVRAESFVLDGEIVALDGEGKPDFLRLQRRMKRERSEAAGQGLVYYVFDLLYLDGYDLRDAALEDRKRLLSTVMEFDTMVRLSDHIVGEGEKLFEMARVRGLEGVIGKHRRGHYMSRRHPSWIKIKCVQTVDCVVVGMTQGQRAGFGALVLGIYDGSRLVHVGSVGSGFNVRLLSTLQRELSSLVVEECPLAVEPKLDDAVRWLTPLRVCEVKFGEWTADGILRFPVFLRMRDDKLPQECKREGGAGEPGAADCAQSTGPLVPSDSPPDMRVDVDNVSIALTNLDKVYFPEDGVTKRDLINYYDAVSLLMLPHLMDRPLNLKRYPDGIHGDFFFQKHGEKLEKWVRRVALQTEDGKKASGVLCNDRATLLYLTNLGCIDQNPLQSRVSSINQPDWLLLDLDPQGCGYDKIVLVAQLLHELLQRLGLRAYPKTTGGRGMHLYVPLAAPTTFAQSTMLAQLLARVAETRRPDLITLARNVRRRTADRVYIDYPQGGRGRSISAPYSVRPHTGATVATPLDWDEVVPGLTPAQFTVRTVLPRFRREGDIFRPVVEGGQNLASAIARVESLLS